MAKFGQLLKEARKENRKTLKEVGKAAGLSLSYMSDFEQGTKSPPKLEVVRAIEQFLNIGDGRLQKAAEVEAKIKPEARSLFKKRPALNTALLRAADYYDEEELTKIINKLLKKKGITE